VSGGSDTAGGWIFLGLVAVAVWYFLIRDSDWLTEYHVAERYGLPESKIVAASRPYDCDFWTAPLGAKHCTYKRMYFVEWLALSMDKPPRPVAYNTSGKAPGVVCTETFPAASQGCYYIDDLEPGEKPAIQWKARRVQIQWRKVEQ
jgi:hypothetical protein